MTNPPQELPPEMAAALHQAAAQQAAPSPLRLSNVTVKVAESPDGKKALLVDVSAQLIIPFEGNGAHEFARALTGGIALP